MNHPFVQALERLGASGAAMADWQRLAGESQPSIDEWLKPTGHLADRILDPSGTDRRLMVVPDGDGTFVAIDDDNPHATPIPIAEDDLRIHRLDMRAIGLALAEQLGFAHGDWESATGPINRVGTLQDAAGHTTPVWLFLPPGNLGDYAALIRHLADLSDATILVPTSRWITRETTALAKRHNLRFHALDSLPATTPLQPGAAGSSTTPGKQAPRAIIRAVTGLAWGQVELVIGANRTLIARAPGQSGEYRFPANIKLTPEHPLGMLMVVAHQGEWRNPPKESPDYERISRSFRRLQKLLATLIPLPGKPFHRSHGAHLPRFQIGIDADQIKQCDRTL